MAKDNKKTSSQGDYDPTVEARVDAMMSEDSLAPKKESSIPKKSIPITEASSSSAPLLPGEKLPKFDDKPPKNSKNPKNQPNEDKDEKPVALAGLVNNIPKKTDTGSPLDKDEYLESEKTGDAVDEIISSESDRLLAIEDAKAEMLAEGTAEIDEGSKFSRALRRFFGSKAFKISFLLILLAGLAAVFIYPDSRYFILNKAGVRASTSLRIVDEQTDQPLKDATVSIGQASAVTDENGNVTLSEISLGEQQVSVSKPAFAPLSKDVVIGWGSNPMGDLGLIATGTRYKFEVKDFLSGKPIPGAEASSDEASAKSDEKGAIELVVSQDEKQTIEAEVSAAGYRTEKIILQIGDETLKKIVLVPAKKHAFVSNRDGNFDLYKVDIDGKNEEKVLEGTGNEREDEISILAHPNRDLIAFVSIRGDERAKDGEPITSLNIVNLDSNEVENVVDSERIQLVDFIDNKLIYIKIQPNSSEESKKRQRLISYDLDSRTEQELASTNYFNDVLAAKGAVYYSPAEYKVNGSVGFYRVNPDGSNRTTILAEEAWNLFRVEYSKINVAISNEWYQYDLDTTQLNKLNGSPPTLKSRVYTMSPNGKKAAWTDIRDGKGVLLIHDPQSGKDKVVQRQSGLVNPLVWIDENHMVYRVATGSETADYAISIDGGDPKKIVDVTNTVGLDRFYLY